MASVITVGNVASNRATNRSTSTYIDRLVPCDGEGYLNQIKVWCSSSLSNFKVAVFRFVSGTTYKCVGVTPNLGSVSSGAERTYNLTTPLFIKAGDFIGCYFSGGAIEADSSGGALSALAGDNTTPGTSYNFTTNNAYRISLLATGITYFDSSFRNTVSWEISTIVENGTGILPVLVTEPLPVETNNTPFIESVQAGTNIIVTAPQTYNGKVFSGWRIILSSGGESIVATNPLTLSVNENLEIRAVYVKPKFRTSVEYLLGPIYVIGDNNVSGFRETVEYVVT